MNKITLFLFLFLFLILSFSSLGQIIDLRKQIKTFPSVIDSLRKQESEGLLTIKYNDTIDIKIVKYCQDSLEYFRIIGNWETEIYDNNSLFIVEKNNIYVFSLISPEEYNQIFTFSILSKKFEPRFDIICENYEIRALSVYEQGSPTCYIKNDYYLGCSSSYSLENEFYKDNFEIRKMINKGKLTFTGQTSIIKSYYIMKFLSIHIH